MRLILRPLRLHLCLFIGLLTTVIAACQGPPPTVYYIVLSPTPETSAASASESVDDTGPSPTPTLSPTPTVSPTPDPFPTPTLSQIQVAEQHFEHGRMFWLRPVRQIWVLVDSETTPGTGVWTVYNDTFEEGQPEIDPTIVAPKGLFQPERGFGRLWRENPEIREALGWALELEFGHVTRYEYRPGGSVNNQNEYIKGPGYHIVYSAMGEGYQFNESDGTWQLVP